VVNNADTTTALDSSANPSVYGQEVTFTATVTVNDPGSGLPTGTVTFLDGSTVLGTGTLDDNGQATFTTSALQIGDHPITAVYGGDSNFNGSMSGILTQTVNPPGGLPPSGMSPRDSRRHERTTGAEISGQAILDELVAILGPGKRVGWESAVLDRVFASRGE
jgi:hypothetical protein